MQQLPIDPGSSKKLDVPCRVCGAPGEVRCYTEICCVDCRKFVYDQKKKSIPGWCITGLKCFIGGERTGYWDSSSNCQACRHDRIEYLGLLDLTFMQKKSRNIPRNLPEKVATNVTGPSMHAFKKPPQAVPSTSSSNTSNSASPLSDKACRICLDLGPRNSKHYGVQTCGTCANFFLRSWRTVNKVHLQCQMTGGAEGMCDLRPSRTGPCRYCRLKKCVEMKMKHADQPMKPGSAVEEMLKILEKEEEDVPDDRVDGPSYDPDAPLFADQVVKEEVKEEEVDYEEDAVNGGINAMDLFMESAATPMAPPPSVCFSPREIKHEEQEPIIDQTTGEIIFPGEISEFFTPNIVTASSTQRSDLCLVCSTFPIAKKPVFGAADVCVPCQLFFKSSAMADGTFKASCVSRKCDLSGDPSSCSFCRLLRCLQIGMSHGTGHIVNGSPIHRLLYNAMEHNWQLFDTPPKQVLPQFLRNIDPVPRLQLPVCHVGKRHCDKLIDIGNGVRSCSKCESFFKYCLEDQPMKPLLCYAGTCSTQCNKTECASCRLGRCLEVGLSAPWRHDNSFFSIFVREWQLNCEDEDVPRTCACGRFIEDGRTSDRCNNCMADSLLQMVLPSASAERPKVTHLQRLTREGLVSKVADGVPSASSSGSRKRKAPHGNPFDLPRRPWVAPIVKKSAGVAKDRMVECQVCQVSFLFKQKNYEMIVCISCAGFFHRSFTEPGDVICRRRKGEDPCSIQRVMQKDLDTRRNIVCSRCRLLKWVSLAPRVPFYPQPLTPLAQLIEQEQVAVLVPDEVRRGYFRVDPIDDNMQMAASKIFQLVMPGERPGYESDEGGSMDSTEVEKEISVAITRALEKNKENEEGEKDDSPEFWRQQGVNAPCAVCGTVRSRRYKKLGPPACERCLKLIETCWERDTEKKSVYCLAYGGVVGRCPRSWKYSLCITCRLERAMAVGCVCMGKPAPSSLADVILRDRVSVAGGEMEQDDNCDTETEGTSPSPSDVNQGGEDVQNEELDKDEACVGCAASYTSFHYNVRMCNSCHGFFRNNMKRASTFHYCKWRNKKMGECDMEINPEVNRICSYCRLKRLLSAGIRLCSENINGSAVSVMLTVEKIPVEFVSGGSYAKKSSVMRVHKEQCQVCPNTPAASHFHGVFLCKDCRSFIVGQWSNTDMPVCANPATPNKCSHLVDQKCNLCRLIKCITVGARSNHQPNKSSFINTLCPGYPDKRTIDEAVLLAAVDRSKKLAKAHDKNPAEAKTIAKAASESASNSPVIIEGTPLEQGLLKENGPKGLLPVPMEHKFDLKKTVEEKVADFWAFFGQLLSPMDTSKKKDEIEDHGYIRGWRSCMIGLEPVFKAYVNWTENLFWLGEMDNLVRNTVIRDASADASVLIVAQVLRVNGCLPYGKNKILRLADLTAFLCEVQHKTELEIMGKISECASLLDQLKLNGRDLELLLNIVLVTKANFPDSVVEEYYMELEDYLGCQELDTSIKWKSVTTLMQTVEETGVLFRAGFKEFWLRRNMSSSLLNLPPMTKLLFKV